MKTISPLCMFILSIFLLDVSSLHAQEQLTHTPGAKLKRFYQYVGVWDSAFYYSFREPNDKQAILREDLKDNVRQSKRVATLNRVENGFSYGPYLTDNYLVFVQSGKLSVISLPDHQLKTYSISVEDFTVSTIFLIHTDVFILTYDNQLFRIDLGTGQERQLSEPTPNLFLGLNYTYGGTGPRQIIQGDSVWVSFDFNRPLYEYNPFTETYRELSLEGISGTPQRNNGRLFFRKENGEFWKVYPEGDTIAYELMYNVPFNYWVQTFKRDYTLMSRSLNAGIFYNDVINNENKLIGGYPVPINSELHYYGYMRSGWFQSGPNREDHVFMFAQDGVRDTIALPCEGQQGRTSFGSSYDILLCRRNPVDRSAYLTNGKDYRYVGEFSDWTSVAYDKNLQADIHWTYSTQEGENFYIQQDSTIFSILAPETEFEGHFYRYITQGDTSLAYTHNSSQRTYLYPLTESITPVEGIEPLLGGASKQSASTDDYVYLRDGSLAKNEIYSLASPYSTAEKISFDLPAETFIRGIYSGTEYLGVWIYRDDYTHGYPAWIENKDQLRVQIDPDNPDYWATRSIFMLGNQMLAALKTPEDSVAAFQVRFPLEESVQLSPAMEGFSSPGYFSDRIVGKTHAIIGLGGQGYITDGTPENTSFLYERFEGSPVYNEGKFYFNRWIFDEATGELTEFSALPGAILSGRGNTILFLDDNRLWTYDADGDQTQALLGNFAESSLRTTLYHEGEFFLFTNEENIIVTDLTPQGTRIARFEGEILWGNLSATHNMVDKHLYFTGNTPQLGYELWALNSETMKFSLIADLVPGPTSSAPFNFHKSGAYVYFSANTEEVGRQLFRIRQSQVTSQDIALTRTSSFNLFPNPAQDIIHLAWDFAETVDIVVWDITGKRTWSKSQVSGKSHSIPILDWPAGIYTCRLVGQNGKIGYQRWVKQK